MVSKISIHLKNPCFIFMFVVLRNIVPKVFLVDSLELETFHHLTCLSLGNWCASLLDWLNQCSCIEAFNC